jgi:hypothetical protein
MLIIKIMALSLQWMCAESCYAKTKSARSGSACGLEGERIYANIDRFKTRPFIASNNCHKGKADKVSTPQTKVKIDCLEAKILPAKARSRNHRHLGRKGLNADGQLFFTARER